MLALPTLDPFKPVAAPIAKSKQYTAEQRQKWRTPNTPDQPILWLVNQTMGVITLDPTSDDNKSVPASNHFTKDDDCLSSTWIGHRSVFMNPPFDKPHLFINKLVDEYRQGHIKEAIGLFKLGVLSNQKTGRIIHSSAQSICLWGAGVITPSGNPSSRIGFIDHEGDQIKGADFDCCLVYWGGNTEIFVENFCHYGAIVFTQHHLNTSVSF